MQKSYLRNTHRKRFLYGEELAEWRKDKQEKKRSYVLKKKTEDPDYQKKWYRKNREKVLAASKQRQDAMREEIRKNGHARRFRALQVLGGECVRCGENDALVLQIDHKVEFHLRGEKRKAKDRGDKLHQRIIAKDPATLEELQVLCANCHLRKTILSNPDNEMMIYNFDKFKENPEAAIPRRDRNREIQQKTQETVWADPGW